MRFILLILMFVGVAVVPVFSLFSAVAQRENQGETAAEQISNINFSWPSNTGTQSDNPTVALHILAHAATQTDSNIIRCFVRSSQAGRTQITYYIYMGAQHTALFSKFTLAQGRWLTSAETHTGSATVSSTVAQVGQKGLVNVLAHAFDLSFLPLNQAFSLLPVAGQYVLESPNSRAADAFIADVNIQLHHYGKFSLAQGSDGQDDITMKGMMESFVGDGLRYFSYIVLSLMAVVAISLFVRQGKVIGVMRLLGFSMVRVWYEVIGKLECLAVIAGLVVSGVILCLVPGVDASFFASLGLVLAILVVASIGVTLLMSLFVVNRMRVSDLVKGALR